MKYMGSKQTMLLNGLGETIRTEAPGRSRVVDLFCGSAAVAWFCAENLDLPVLAYDLQSYAVALADAVIGRTKPVDAQALVDEWLGLVRKRRSSTANWRAARAAGVRRTGRLRKTDVLDARRICAITEGGLVWGAYGGHYFSPTQAVSFDLMLKSLPTRPEARSACLGSLIMAASRCAASPGHTAQPFSPSVRALPHIQKAWSRDPVAEAARALAILCPKHALAKGRAKTRDANDAVKEIREGDLVFIDPPYSAVQYSRFYHVLETITRGEIGQVDGVGRYPPFEDRPRSAYSLVTAAEEALGRLLKDVAMRGANVILTFPDGEASNGLSGARVSEIAASHSKVLIRKVAMRFSTMGGNNSHRPSRHQTHELILTLRPR